MLMGIYISSNDWTQEQLNLARHSDLPLELPIHRYYLIIEYKRLDKQLINKYLFNNE